MNQDQKDMEITDLKADLACKDGRILNLQEEVESLGNVIATKNSRIESLERENATLRSKLAANDTALRITMVQNLARRAA